MISLNSSGLRLLIMLSDVGTNALDALRAEVRALLMPTEITMIATKTIIPIKVPKFPPLTRYPGKADRNYFQPRASSAAAGQGVFQAVGLSFRVVLEGSEPQVALAV